MEDCRISKDIVKRFSIQNIIKMLEIISNCNSKCNKISENIMKQYKIIKYVKKIKDVK